jgi:hypothetical protein
MIETLRQRVDLLGALFPWDDVNFGIDERWARIHPYGQEARPGAWIEVTVRIRNHSDKPQIFEAVLNVPEGFAVRPDSASVKAEAGQEMTAHFQVKLPGAAQPGVQVVTADILFSTWNLRQWCEGLLKIVP